MLLKKTASFCQLRRASASKECHKPLARVPSSKKFPRDFFQKAISHSKSMCRMENSASAIVAPKQKEFTFREAFSSCHSTVEVKRQPCREGRNPTTLKKISRQTYHRNYLQL